MQQLHDLPIHHHVAFASLELKLVVLLLGVGENLGVLDLTVGLGQCLLGRELLLQLHGNRTMS